MFSAIGVRTWFTQVFRQKKKPSVTPDRAVATSLNVTKAAHPGHVQSSAHRSAKERRRRHNISRQKRGNQRRPLGRRLRYA